MRFLRSDDRETEASLRDSLRQVIIAWLFGATWMYLASGAAFTRYAKLLNVSEFGFGILAAIPFVGAMAQLPTSFLLERYGHRKQVFLWACSLHRALWLVIAALPWLLPASWQWSALITLMMLSTLLANIATPAWMAWMADLIPSRIRARYFSRRIQFGQAVGVVLCLLSGVALDWPDKTQTVLLRNIISAMFAVAGVFGIVDILLFIRVPDCKVAQHRPQLSFLELVRKPLANRNFRLFLGYSATMTLATGYIGQFVWLYLLDEVGMSNLRANCLLMAIPILVSIGAYPFWGRIIDRFGCKPALLLAGILVVNGATSWVFVTRESWIPGYVFVLSATLAWPGMDLAAFNLLLRMTSTGDRGQASSSAVIAINSMVVAVAGTLSGLLGGVVASQIGSTWHCTLLGWPITYYAVLFLISAVLRLGALCWLMALKEDRNIPTRDALRYLVSNVYSNLQQATFFSARMFSTLTRRTWRLPASRRPPRPPP